MHYPILLLILIASLTGCATTGQPAPTGSLTTADAIRAFCDAARTVQPIAQAWVAAHPNDTKAADVRAADAFIFPTPAARCSATPYPATLTLEDGVELVIDLSTLRAAK